MISNTMSHAEGAEGSSVFSASPRLRVSNYPEVFVTNGVEHPVWSPQDLRKYDPKLFAILAKMYPDHRIPADVYHGKKLR